MFTRKHQYKFPIPKEHLKYRLLGNHITVHHHDFEVLESEDTLSIRPMVEESASNKGTLPVTDVALNEQGNQTEMVLTSRMPEIQAGAQMVIMLFCIFFMAASFTLLYVGNDPVITITLCGISLMIFVLFLIRLQVSYFDYVRGIRTHLKRTGDEITTDVRRQLFKHKTK